MNVLVPGGAGFIGSHLCDALLALGHRVTALDNLLTGTRENIAHLEGRTDFRFLQADIVDPLPDVEVDAIFHLASAASPEGYGRHPIETLMTNSMGTRRLLDLARAQRARFLLASTSEIYGDPLVHPQPETYWGNVNPVGPRACYDEGKRFAEAITMTFIEREQVDGRIIRIFNTYGPRNQPDDGRVVPNFLSQGLRGRPLTVYGDGLQTRSFCFVSDLVQGILRAMFAASTTGEVINLGNPAEVTILQLAETVKQVTGAASEIRRVPGRPEEIARRKPDIAKAGRLLDWQPQVPLQQGLAETAAWLRGILPDLSLDP